MAKNIYVGNIPWSATEEEVRDLFAAYGEVTSVKFINDRETGRFRGFGFVEMEEDGAEEAIQALDGSDFGGRALKVNEARPRPERQPRW
ncbi:MAG: RNA recognition motif domain-containing protein [Desulfovibrionales bacterium]